MNRSQLSSKFGRLVEVKAAERFGLDLDHSPVRGVRVDALDPSDGSPWDVKGAMTNRKRGKGRFRLWKDQHDVLEAEGGGYVFVRYRAVDNGIRVLEMRRVPARAIRCDWGGSGDHRRDSPQAKILAMEVFK